MFLHRPTGDISGLFTVVLVGIESVNARGQEEELTTCPIWVIGICAPGSGWNVWWHVRGRFDPEKNKGGLDLNFDALPGLSPSPDASNGPFPVVLVDTRNEGHCGVSHTAGPHLNSLV